MGAGGNGYVWQCADADGTKAAIKFLKWVDKKAYARFAAEIDVLQRNSDIPGVLPMLDKSLPKLGTGEPWYVMPLAQPLHKLDLSWDLGSRLDVVLELAEVVVRLHARDITHRDIKPSNVLRWNGRYYLGDFGLANFPDKESVSDHSEEIGAKWTIAPEMRRESELADHKKADVYSLAKTMWILLTRKGKGFEGQYTIDSSVELRRFHADRFTDPLDQLLAKSTDMEPARRPTAQEFVDCLKEWKALDKDFRGKNHRQWLGMQQRLFPGIVPQRVTWTNVEEIRRILEVVASYKSGNHLFFPDSGGLDLVDAKLSFEAGCIELRFGRIDIVKPRALTFESFAADPVWNYFYLELDDLEPLPSVAEDTEGSRRSAYKEVLSELAPGKYHSHDVIEDPWRYAPSYFAAMQPRHVVRWFKGNMLIVCKQSPYNLDHTTYDARHNTLGRDGFRTYMEKAATQARLSTKRVSEEAPDSKQVLALEAVLAMVKDRYPCRCPDCGKVADEKGVPFPAAAQSQLVMLCEAYGGWERSCEPCMVLEDERLGGKPGVRDRRKRRRA